MPFHKKSASHRKRCKPTRQCKVCSKHDKRSETFYGVMLLFVSVGVLRPTIQGKIVAIM